MSPFPILVLRPRSPATAEAEQFARRVASQQRHARRRRWLRLRVALFGRRKLRPSGGTQVAARTA